MESGNTVFLCRSVGDPWECILISDPSDALYVLEHDGRRIGPYPKDRVKASPEACPGFSEIAISNGTEVLIRDPADRSGPSWPGRVESVHKNGRITVKMKGLGRAQTLDASWVNISKA